MFLPVGPALVAAVVAEAEVEFERLAVNANGFFVDFG